MFIANNRTWSTRTGEQRSSGAFLILCLGPGTGPWTGGNLRAMVRHVRMHQSGHYMMGFPIIRTTYWQAPSEGKPGRTVPARAKLHLSGTFGSDGLPKSACSQAGKTAAIRDELPCMDWREVGNDYAGRPYSIPREHTDTDPCWYSKGVPFQVYERMMPVPNDIAHAMAHDDTGHNSAGVQACKLLPAWARDNLGMLRRAGGLRSPFPLAVPNTYEVVSLDVWGNALNGYDINDWYATGRTVTFMSNWNDARMLKELRDRDFTNKHVTARSFSLDDPSASGQSYTLVDNRQPRLVQSDETAVTHGHGRPILELRRVSERMPAPRMYAVIVGNIGTVYDGDSRDEATTSYTTYVKQSMDGIGRAAGEPVTLTRDGEIILEHEGDQTLE